MGGAGFDETFEDLVLQQAAILQHALVGHQEIARRLREAGVPLKIMPSLAFQDGRTPITTPPHHLSEPPGISTNPNNQCFQSAASSFGVGLKSPERVSLQEPLLQAQAQPQEERRCSTSRTRAGSAQERVVARGSNSAQDRGSQVIPVESVMKAKLVEKMSKPVYSVETLYSKTGWAQAIARNDEFQAVMLVIVLANTLWIAIDTDYNKAPLLCDAPPLFQIVNNLFCGAFVLEILVRFLAFDKKASCLKDGWFVFDLSLVVLMAWETWIEVALFLIYGIGGHGGRAAAILRVFRMLRLTRVARLARIIRLMPELMILVKGMVIATRSVGAAMLLLLVIIYIFAVLFTEQLAGTEAAAGCFDNVPQSMNCLLLHGVFGEAREFIEQMYAIHWTYYVVIIVYMLTASCTVLNMLIGVLCEVISVTAKVEQEEIVMQDLRTKLTDLMRKLHGDSHHLMSRQRFDDLLHNSEAREALESVGVDALALGDFSDYIFQESSELPLGEFMERVLQLRGTNTATVKDVVDFRMFVQQELDAVRTDFRKFINDAPSQAHATNGAGQFR